MPQRSFKTMFVELVSFLTLFSLVGTISSNFWERYLIQSELSNMKSSLHVLKETIFNIGTAYDNLNHELKGLVDMRDIKLSNSIPREAEESSSSDHRNSKDLNVYFNVLEERTKHKINKSTGNTASKGTESHCTPQKFNVHDVTTITRHPPKTIGVNSVPEKPDSPASLKTNDEKIQNNHIYTRIHRCCKEPRCCKYLQNRNEDCLT